MKTHCAVLAVLACSTIGCGRSEEQKFRDGMLRVLKADQELGAKRDLVSPKIASPSQLANSIGQYCAAMDKLDMSDSPAEFRVAYRHHMRAWSILEVAVRQLPEDFLEGTLVGLLNGLTGEVDGGYSRMMEAVRTAQQEVLATYQDVEKIAGKYGAAL